MAEPRKRKQRTWSAFGDVRRMPSEYEIVTNRSQWTLREGRRSALEQNPSSPSNLWFQTYREGSAIQVPTWDGFGDPDTLIYRRYVAVQNEQEKSAAAVLDEYSDEQHDRKASPEWVQALHLLFTTTRFPMHAAQMVQAYIGFMSPDPHIMNAAGFSAADMLRRVSLVAYRTRELQLAWPEHGFSTGERELWCEAEAWQPARLLFEKALVTYDWAEAFTAMNLVALPTLDELLLSQLRRVAHAQGDELTWILLGNLGADSERRARWSTALASFAVQHNPDNRAVFERWIEKWAVRADRAAEALSGAIASAHPTGLSATDLTSAAANARNRTLAQAGLVDGERADAEHAAAVSR